MYGISGMLSFLLLAACASNNPVLPTTILEESPQVINRGLHTVYLLETGDEALLARIYLIRKAKKTIDIQTFIWVDDEVGQFVFQELRAAAERGVRVRLLIDDLSLRKIPEHVAGLATLHSNILIKQYNPLDENISIGALGKIKDLAFDFGSANQRMHNKVFIVDGLFGITGGRNYQNNYFDRGKTRLFKDRDILVKGPVATDMSASFEAYWTYERSVLSRDMVDVRRQIDSGSVPEPTPSSEVRTLGMFRDIDACANTEACFSQRLSVNRFSVQQIEFVADAPGKLADEELVSATTQKLINLVRSAQNSMVFETPYLVVGEEGTKLLKSIRKSRPELRMIVSTNSLASADHFYAYAFSYKNKKKYLRNFRWEISELKPRPQDIDILLPPIDGVVRNKDHYACIHSKTFLFDHDLVWIGSFNFDPRSGSLNTEAGLLLRNMAMASRVNQTILSQISPANSWTVGVRQKIPLWGYINGLIENIFSRIPFLNVWPFTYTSSFELMAGGTAVPFYHPEFRENYRSVGQFPGVNLSTKALKTRMAKAFFGPAEPII